MNGTTTAPSAARACPNCGALPELRAEEPEAWGLQERGTNYFFCCPCCGFRTASGYQGHTIAGDTTAQQAQAIALDKWNAGQTAQAEHEQMRRDWMRAGYR